MANRAVIDTGDTMVAMIMDILEHVESEQTAQSAVCVGDRVRVLSGLYAGVVGEVKLIISSDDGPLRGRRDSMPFREII